MKKRLFLILVLIFTLCMVTVSKAEFENNSIHDGAYVLSGDEEEKLEKMLDEISEEYSIDVSIVTANNMAFEDAEGEAYAIYDAWEFGYGEERDGLLLYVAVEPREFAYAVNGYGYEAFNDKGLAYLDEEITPYLMDDDFYGAFLKYTELTGEMLEMAENGKPYGTGLPWYTILIVLAMAFVIALSMMLYKLSLMKTARNDNYARNYVKDGSFRMNLSRDIFLYSHVTRRKKEKDSGSKPGSGNGRGGRSGSF